MMNNPNDKVDPPVSDKEMEFVKAMGKVCPVWGSNIPSICETLAVSSQFGLERIVASVIKLSFYSGAVWGQSYEHKNKIGQLSVHPDLPEWQEVLHNATTTK